MNFYRHNIGDYRTDTGHLSLLEHGIYRQLLDQYYNDENPISLDLNKVKRSLCVRTQDEEKALANVLNDFFELTDQGYIHKRCEKEITSIYEKSEKARQSAKRRWDKEKQQVTNSEDANAMRTHEERNTSAMLPSNLATQLPSNLILNNIPNPTEKDGAHKTSKRIKTYPDCPHEKIIKIYHEKLPMCQRMIEWHKTRASHLKNRWSESPDRQDLVWWENFFEYILKSPFLIGDIPGKQGAPPFQADLEWILKKGNFVKIIEGKYHRESKTA